MRKFTSYIIFFLLIFTVIFDAQVLPEQTKSSWDYLYDARNVGLDCFQTLRNEGLPCRCHVRLLHLWPLCSHISSDKVDLSNFTTAKICFQTYRNHINACVNYELEWHQERIVREENYYSSRNQEIPIAVLNGYPYSYAKYQAKEDLKKYHTILDEAEKRIGPVYKKYYRAILEETIYTLQKQKAYYELGFIHYQTGEIEQSLDCVDSFIGLGGKTQNDEKLDIDYLALQGGIFLDICAYNDAIITLSKVIESDPSRKEAYFQRAVAYFETGQFELSIKDYIASDSKNTTIDPSISHKVEFSHGLIFGVVQGAKDGVSDYVPSILRALSSTGNGLWAFANDPQRISNELVDGCQACIEYTKNHSSQEIIQDLVPELKILVKTWDSIDDYTRGLKTGEIIGKYGVDVFGGLGTAKGVQLYRNLRKANQSLTLELYVSNVGSSEIAQSAMKNQALREYVGLSKDACRLNGANKAIIDPRKLTEYSLDPNSVKGGHKARVFEAALGYNQSNYKELMKQIQIGVMNYIPIPGKIDQYGIRFTVDMLIVGPKGTAKVRTGWIFRWGSQIPHLTTALVK